MGNQRWKQNQISYLRRVRNAMLFHFSHREIRVTLEDLAQIFSSGTADGRTEEDLCTELGAPKEFVNTLLEEKEKDPFRDRCIACVLAGIALCVLTRNGLRYWSPLWNSIPVALVPVYLWFMSGGGALYEISDPYRNSRQGRNLRLFCALIYGIFLLVSAVSVAFQQNIITKIDSILTEDGIGEELLISVHRMENYRMFLLGAGLVIFVIAAWLLYLGHTEWMGLLFLAGGMICTCIAWRTYLMHLGEPGDGSVDIILVPYIVGILLWILWSTVKPGRNKK